MTVLKFFQDFEYDCMILQWLYYVIIWRKSKPFFGFGLGTAGILIAGGAGATSVVWTSS